jgi:cytochrome c peroxidase
MKRTHLLIFILASLIMTSAYVSNINKRSAIVLIQDDENPTLPRVPFKYKLNLPAHFKKPIVVYYEKINIDTTVFPIIGDDVATLGRVLFYDKKLSAREDLSCGTCHLQANSFSDPVALSRGNPNKTKHNSLHLNDLAWSNNTSFFWARKTKTLYEAIQLPLKDGNEIGATTDDVLAKISLSDYYPTLFKKAYGDDLISEWRVVNALTQFIQSINSFESKFDKVKNGTSTFTKNEDRGEKIFVRDCGICHSQIGNSQASRSANGNLKIEALKLFNGYRGSDTSDKGAVEGLDTKHPLFKTPTLRNIAFTAPFMHDGGLKDLDAVIDFYSEQIPNVNLFHVKAGGFSYDKTDKECLKAFLLTLSDSTMVSNEKWSNPFKNNNLPSTSYQATINVYPNPVSNTAEIRLKGWPEETKTVLLYDNTGRLVLSDKIYYESYILDRKDLSVGAYVMVVKCKDKSVNYKIMVR